MQWFVFERKNSQIGTPRMPKDFSFYLNRRVELKKKFQVCQFWLFEKINLKHKHSRNLENEKEIAHSKSRSFKRATPILLKAKSIFTKLLFFSQNRKLIWKEENKKKHKKLKTCGDFPLVVFGFVIKWRHDRSCFRGFLLRKGETNQSNFMPCKDLPIKRLQTFKLESMMINR